MPVAAKIPTPTQIAKMALKLLPDPDATYTLGVPIPDDDRIYLLEPKATAPGGTVPAVLRPTITPSSRTAVKTLTTYLRLAPDQHWSMIHILDQDMQSILAIDPYQLQIVLDLNPLVEELKAEAAKHIDPRYRNCTEFAREVTGFEFPSRQLAPVQAADGEWDFPVATRDGDIPFLMAAKLPNRDDLVTLGEKTTMNWDNPGAALAYLDSAWAWAIARGAQGLMVRIFESDGTCTDSAHSVPKDTMRENVPVSGDLQITGTLPLTDYLRQEWPTRKRPSRNKAVLKAE